MTPSEVCHPYRERIGAFVLGKLEGADLEAVQAHLDGCPFCRAEARELGPVVAALTDADPDRIDEYPRPPGGLEESTLAPILKEIRFSRGRRSWWSWSALSAAAIFAVVIGLAAGLSWLVEPAVALEPLSFSKEPGVKPRGYLIAHNWGTDIRLAASGLRDGETYRVTLVSEDRDRVNAGTFIGAGDKLSRGTFTAALSRKDADRLEVRAPGGELAFYSELPENPKNEPMEPGDSGGKKGPGAEDKNPADTPERPKAGGSGGGTPPSNENPSE